MERIRSLVDAEVQLGADHFLYDRSHTWLTEAMVTFYNLVICNFLVCKIGGHLLFLAQLPLQNFCTKLLSW